MCAPSNVVETIDGACALENVEPGERLHIVGGNVNEYCLYRKQDEGLKQNEIKHSLKIGLSCNLEVPLTGAIQRKSSQHVKKICVLILQCSGEPRFRFELNVK